MKSNRDHDYILKLSKEAEDDIRDIQQYTFENYGERQVFEYSKKLDNVLSMILQNPAIGHKRTDTPPEYKTYPVEQHIIIFRVDEKTIYVVRVLHSPMDFSKQIEKD
jgi:toxin ParE1/3/4